MRRINKRCLRLVWAEVTSANAVTVYHRNDTGAAVDVASGTLTVKIV